jgi:hypothetical protein
MEIILFWLAFSIIAGIIAGNKGRSRFGFFLLSVILSPIIGVIGALIAKPDKAKIERIELSSGGMKRCPFCAELVKKKAIVCRHCGKDLPTEELKQKTKPDPTHLDNHGFRLENNSEPSNLNDIYKDPLDNWFKKK